MQKYAYIQIRKKPESGYRSFFAYFLYIQIRVFFFVWLVPFIGTPGIRICFRVAGWWAVKGCGVGGGWGLGAGGWGLGAEGEGGMQEATCHW